MITTGSPAASLLATCGNEPIDLGPPFGGRQGTRLKMSVADFATSFTLSIALLVMLLCAAGADGSTVAALPAEGGVWGLAASALVASVFALSDSVACCALWAPCACAGAMHGSANAATASAVSNVFR